MIVYIISYVMSGGYFHLLADNSHDIASHLGFFKAGMNLEHVVCCEYFNGTLKVNSSRF